MGKIAIASKTCLSLLALLFLIVVAATPSLFMAKAGSTSFGAFETDGVDSWEGFESICSEVKAYHGAMQAGLIICILTVACGTGSSLAGHYTANSMLDTAAICFEVLQIIGGVMFFISTLVVFLTRFDCMKGISVKDVFNLGYGFYLFFVALVFIFFSMCIGVGEMVMNGSGGQGQSFDQPSPYSKQHDQQSNSQRYKQQSQHKTQQPSPQYSPYSQQQPSPQYSQYKQQPSPQYSVYKSQQPSPQYSQAVFKQPSQPYSPYPSSSHPSSPYGYQHGAAPYNLRL